MFGGVVGWAKIVTPRGRSWSTRARAVPRAARWPQRPPDAARAARKARRPTVGTPSIRWLRG